MTAEPTIFGRYQLLERIAEGGMAEVFKARLAAVAGTEKVLCIKRIHPTHSRNREFISLFVKEAEISLSLTHGNITQVFDFGEVDGVYFLAMELILGQDLSAALTRLREVNTALDVPTALYIAAEVCKGLHYAHSFTDGAGRKHAVVHRDVTPHNILIAYTGEVKLTDFGIALAATKVAAGPEVVRGKACYLAPEQAGGQPATVRSDIFSLGTVLYEMITGQRPFAADSDRETLELVRQAEVAPPSQLNDQVDGALDQVVLKALSRQPEERFASAAELQLALTQILHTRWPDYTGQRLAELMGELFAWELSQGGKGGSDRDRLLFQLSRAGVKLDGAKDVTTGELLDMGTVALPGAAPPESDGPGRNWLLWGGGGAAFGLLALILIWIAWPGGDTRAGGGQPATQHDAGPMINMSARTEHLAPPSVSEPRPAPKPEPAQASAKRPERAVPPKMAYLNCNSWPWSVVYINGRRMRGNTPLYRVRVAAGRHRLRFVNPELGLSKEVTVSVRPGNTKTVAVSLQQ